MNAFHHSKTSFRRLCCSFLLLALTSGAVASGKLLQVNKSADRTTASIRDNQWFKYRLAYNCSSTTDNAVSAVLADVLDPNLDLVGLIGSIHTTGANYDSATRKVTFTFRNPLPAGSSGEVFIQARFKSTTPGNTEAKNVAYFRASNSETAQSNEVKVTGINPNVVGGGTPGSLSFVKGVSVTKSPDGGWLNAQAGWTTWSIRHGNTGFLGQNAADYFIEDTFPVGTMLDRFATDGWYFTDNPVTVFYKTNLNSSYRQWGAGARYRTGASGVTIYASELALPVGEYVTGMKWSYATLPGGGLFHPSMMSRLLRVVTRIVDPLAPTSVAGTKVINCATASATGETSRTGCGETTISSPGASFGFGHWVSTGSAPYDMGELINFTTSVGVNPQSDSDLIDPSLGVLLPKEVSYVGNPTISGAAYDLAGKPAPVFEQIDDYKGTGRTLVRWLWSPARGNGWSIKANRDWKYFNINFTARVKAWTPNGNYVSTMFGSWMPAGRGYGWFETDADDWNNNTDVAELRARHDTGVWVQTAGGSAGFDSQMFVKGELDTDWTMFPAKGLTIPGGKADYQIKFTNPSGVVMRNLVLIDILPTVGDKGVIDLSSRGSQWSPYLAAPVAAEGATVSYSLSSNPCRDELTPGIPVGCDPPNWTVIPPADITKVKSLKIDFGATKILPGQTVTINWPMRAALNAPINGEIAWNSFGYTARRDDNSIALLASEPVKTGIAIKPPVGPFYGDFVWNDLNQNGIQDAGEPGVNGIRVELYKDNGDGINNPASDTLAQFTTTAWDGAADGAYLFSNTGVGSFYAVVVVPQDWGISTSDQGGDDARDSDGEAIIFNGGRAALMPVTSLDAQENDRSWDVGIYDRSGKPSVWAVAELSDGRVVLGGRFQTSHGLPRRNIAIVNADGSVDQSFNPGSGFDGSVRSVALVNGGRILVGGDFSTYNGSPAPGVALLKADGYRSTLLDAPDVNQIRWVAADSKGLYIGGYFNNVGGVPCRNIARYKLDGKLDTNFDSTTGANGIVHGGGIQPDGSVIIVGNFTAYKGVTRNRVARILPTGQLDTTFDPLQGANKEVFAVKLIEDGRVVITGSFDSFAGQASNGTMRLLPDGKCDPTINPSGLTVDSIQTTN